MRVRIPWLNLLINFFCLGGLCHPRLCNCISRAREENFVGCFFTFPPHFLLRILLFSNYINLGAMRFDLIFGMFRLLRTYCSLRPFVIATSAMSHPLMLA
jgi:hypothetical protein